MKISFCTQVKNRYKHLNQTLPVNLKILSGWENVELTLLNFSSDDYNEQELLNLYQPYIETGLLRYVKLENQLYYHQTAAKNSSHRASTGEYIINVDADNFLTDEFMNTVMPALTENVVIRCATLHRDIFGRIGMHKTIFNYIGGYDERMSTYGYEDVDLLKRIGRYKVSHDVEYVFVDRICSGLSHDNSLRVQMYDKSIIKEWNNDIANRLQMSSLDIERSIDNNNMNIYTKNEEDSVVRVNQSGFLFNSVLLWNYSIKSFEPYLL